MSAGLKVSVAVPVFNEEAVIPELYRRIAAVLDQIPGGPHEMVFVDDGSRDRTADLLETLAGSDARVALVSLSRNFGHQVALTAALDHVSGDVTVLLDGDLQDPPEAIPVLLEWYEKGYDVVYVRRTNRKVDEIRRMPEQHRYIRGLRTWVGFKQVGVPMERSARHAGRTKYSPLRLLKLASDGIFAFSIVPLRAAAMLGVIAVALSGLFALYAVIAKFWLNRSPQGFTALIVVVAFMAGVNLFFLGVIGEYVGRIYEESKARPHYIVRKIVGKAREDLGMEQPIARSSVASE